MKCEAVFDRLGPALPAQAYQLLVPSVGDHGHHRPVSPERTPAMPTAAIYARVSSARQKEQQTIQSQTAALLAHAAKLGLDVPAEWVFEDDGCSGATLVRPALERLRDLADQ
ncbi:MAG TPA: recombinase family protein, partial [Streptosporangiaceae bacterium]